MNITDTNFDLKLQEKEAEIEVGYETANNNALVMLSAHKTCIKCIKEKGFSFINNNKNEINDCNSKLLDGLSWQKLINKVFQDQVTIGKKNGGKKTKKKNKKLSRNRKKTNRRLKCKKM